MVDIDILVPDETHQTLSARAAAESKPLSIYAREQLVELARIEAEAMGDDPESEGPEPSA